MAVTLVHLVHSRFPDWTDGLGAPDALLWSNLPVRFAVTRGLRGQATGLHGSGKGSSAVALPFDQVVRQQRFLQAHPEWAIHAQDRGSRFTAEKNDGSRVSCRGGPIPGRAAQPP